MSEQPKPGDRMRLTIGGDVHPMRSILRTPDGHVVNYSRLMLTHDVGEWPRLSVEGFAEDGGELTFVLASLHPDFEGRPKDAPER